MRLRADAFSSPSAQIASSRSSDGPSSKESAHLHAETTRHTFTMLDRAYRQRELAHKSPATRRMYDRFPSRLAAVNNNLEKYMPSGIEVDGISFNELALVNRPEHAAVLGRIFTSWSLIESSITALLGLLFIVRRGYGIPPNPRSHTPNLTPNFGDAPVSLETSGNKKPASALGWTRVLGLPGTT